MARVKLIWFDHSVEADIATVAATVRALEQELLHRSTTNVLPRSTVAFPQFGQEDGTSSPHQPPPPQMIFLSSLGSFIPVQTTVAMVFIDREHYFFHAP